MEKLNQHTNQQALTNSIEEGLRIQAQNRLQRMLKQQQKKAAETVPPQEPVACTNKDIKREKEEQSLEREKEEQGITIINVSKHICVFVQMFPRYILENH